MHAREALYASRISYYWCLKSGVMVSHVLLACSSMALSIYLFALSLPSRILQRDEHTEREVAILQCLRERTGDTVPEIIAYGFGGTGHPKLGPFIITVFIQGIS